MKKFLIGIGIGILIASVPAAIAIVRTFIDVPSNAWYATAVNSLHNKNIVSGYGDNTFRPTQNLTRAEAAAMLNQAVNYLEGRRLLYEDTVNRFSFAYPIRYMKVQNNLWLPEVYEDHVNYTGSSSVLNIPSIEVRVDDANGRSLGQFIIDKFSLGIATLGQTQADRNVLEQRGFTVTRNMRLGRNEFIAVDDIGLFGTTREYYTLHNGKVFMLGATPKQNYDADMRRILETLKFD